MRPRPAPLLVAFTLLAGLTACGGDGGADGSGGAPEGTDGAFDGTVDGTDADEPVDGVTDGQAGGGGDLDAATAAAVADLASAEGVPEADVAVVTAEQVTWRDGALGCPEPGMMYTQALVPGYRVILAVDGREVAYHGAEGSDPTRCDDPQPPTDTDA